MAVELSLESCAEFNYVERGASQVKKWAWQWQNIWIVSFLYDNTQWA